MYVTSDVHIEIISVAVLFFKCLSHNSKRISLKLASFMQYKSQLMWQKGYAIKAKNDIVVNVYIVEPVF